VPVKLRRGVNTLLLKVVQVRGQWGLYVQVLGADGGPATGLKTTLTPPG